MIVAPSWCKREGMYHYRPSVIEIWHGRRDVPRSLE
jgi:hypothetical protein